MLNQNKILYGKHGITKCVIGTLLFCFSIALIITIFMLLLIKYIDWSILIDWLNTELIV